MQNVKSNHKGMPVSSFALDIHISNLLSVYTPAEILFALRKQGLLAGAIQTKEAK
jgi:hypothetical protein